MLGDAKGRRAVESSLKEIAMRKIAGDITLSSFPGQAMKKWRELFGLKQREVARYMSISPSVLSDYENSKRRSPGIGFIKKYVESIIELDSIRGGVNIHRLADLPQSMLYAIIDIKEFKAPVKLSEIASVIDAIFLTHKSQSELELYGYTVVDSLSAIRYMDSTDFIHLFGLNSMRLIVFSEVTTGRSPLVAVKVFPIKPRALAIHGPRSPKDVDWLAIELSESIGIPLILSRMGSVNSLIDALRGLGG